MPDEGAGDLFQGQAVLADVDEVVQQPRLLAAEPVAQPDQEAVKPPGQIVWQGKPLTREQFRQAMVDEKRLIYELEIERAYGMLGR